LLKRAMAVMLSTALFPLHPAKENRRS